MLGMGVTITALQDGTEQLSCSTLKRDICYDSSLPEKVQQIDREAASRQLHSVLKALTRSRVSDQADSFFFFFF